MSKRDLQADIVMMSALINAEMYEDAGYAYVKTGEVMRLFGCHRSTATRIMDYCAMHNHHCELDAIYIGGGRYSKAVVVDAARLIRADWGIAHRIWVNAHRNRIALGVSYATLDALKAISEVMRDSAK